MEDELGSFLVLICMLAAGLMGFFIGQYSYTDLYANIDNKFILRSKKSIDGLFEYQAKNTNGLIYIISSKKDTYQLGDTLRIK